MPAHHQERRLCRITPDEEAAAALDFSAQNPPWSRAMTNQPFFTTDGDAFIPTPAANGPWDPKSLHGRVIIGLLAFVIEQRHGGDDFVPARLTVDMFRLPGFAPIEVKTKLVRHGMRIRVVDPFLARRRWRGLLPSCCAARMRRAVSTHRRACRRVDVAADRSRVFDVISEWTIRADHRRDQHIGAPPALPKFAVGRGRSTDALRAGRRSRRISPVPSPMPAIAASAISTATSRCTCTACRPRHGSDSTW